MRGTILQNYMMTGLLAMIQTGQEAIDVANRSSNRIFYAYIAILILTGLSVAFFTVLSWRASNNVQSGIKRDADVRIAEANERTLSVERGNLLLRSQVATLEKDASDAKAAQQLVETDLGKQKERTAIAEKALLELQQKVADRSLTNDQRVLFEKEVKGKIRGELTVTAVGISPEAVRYAEQIGSFLKTLGWHVHYEHTLIAGPKSSGLQLWLVTTENLHAVDPSRPNDYLIPQTSAIYHAAVVQAGFQAAGIECQTTSLSTKMNVNKVTLMVGVKP